MFFLMTTLEHTIPLHPSYFTPSIRAYLKQQLYSRVEGTCSGRLGYIVAVVSMHDEILRGLVVGGQAEFIVKYTAIVYKPFKNEVVDGVVASVNKMGIFADVGPLTCFISTHLIPPEFKFDPNSNPPCFNSPEDTQKIEKGTQIRLKIVGTRVDATEIFAIGTIKEDYLGPLG